MRIEELESMGTGHFDSLQLTIDSYFVALIHDVATTKTRRCVKKEVYFLTKITCI